jgi:RHS repeat-associated protein
VTWAYDNLWRLTNETIAGSAVSGSIGYVYDNVGNRLSRSSSVGGIANQTSTYDNDDRLLADGWDPNGNTLSSNGSQYGYDSENRLLSLNASQAHYVYDGDGQLVSKTAGGVTTTYLIDSENPTGYTQIAEERVGGVAQKSYVYGPQRITMRDGSGLHYYGYDAHSGVRLLLDGSGNVTDTWDYDAFGNVVARTGSTANSFTYRGEQMDSALGLEYLRARWMDPAKGRFATRDPWQGTLQQPSSLNQFMYATDDPLLHPDPAGLCDCTLPSVTIAAGVQQILVSVAVSALAIKAVSDARDIAGQRTDYRDVYWRGLTSFDLEDLSLSRGKVIWSWASRMLMDKAAAWALALAPSSAQRHYTDPALVGSDGSPFVGVTKGKQLARAKAQRYGTNLIVEFRTDRKPLWTPADPLGNDFESESLFFWDIGGGPNDLLWGPY